MATVQKLTEQSETTKRNNNCRQTAYNDAENRFYQKPAIQTFPAERGAFRERTDLYNSSKEPWETTLTMKIEKEMESMCSSVNLFEWIFEDEFNHKTVQKKQPICSFTVYEDDPALFGIDEASNSIPSNAAADDTCNSMISKGICIPNPSIAHEAGNCIPADADDAYSSTLTDTKIDACNPTTLSVDNDTCDRSGASAKGAYTYCFTNDSDGDEHYDYYTYDAKELVYKSDKCIKVLGSIKEEPESEEDKMLKKHCGLNALKDTELNFLPRSDYMAKQPQISYELRSDTVDWMIHVADVLDLECEALFLAVNYLDRFLSKMSISKDKIQFLGLVALYIASNQTEEFEVDVDIFVNLVQDAITEFQVLELEKRVVKTLETGLGASTAYHFVTQLLQAVFASQRISTLTCYLLELTLIEGKAFIKYIPSITATSCFCLANALDKKLTFMDEVTYLTGYHLEDLNDCIHDVFDALCAASAKTGLAVREKYSNSKMYFVTEMKVPESCPTNFV